MEMGIEKASGRSVCRNEECKCLPEYITLKGRIKAGTICAWVSTEGADGTHTSYYCRDCIDMIYRKLKKTFNSDLWIFD